MKLIRLGNEADQAALVLVLRHRSVLTLQASNTHRLGVELGLSLARARPAEAEGPRWHNGEIETTGHICAAGGAASIEILELQPDNGRLMTLTDFRRGHPWMAGMRLVKF